MPLETVLAWLNLVLLIFGFIGAWIYFGRKLGLLEENLIQGLHSIAAYMESHGLLLGALSEGGVITQAKMKEIQDPLLKATRDPINRLLSKLAGGNPITQGEVKQLRNYTYRVQGGERLTKEEAEEFYRLSKKLEGEDQYKHDIGTVFLVGLAAFVLGLIVGSQADGKK